ncbi:hypothetical protein RD792_010312, partial [Penstemon davidsonii]
LSYDTNESILKQAFEEYGEVIEAKVICDRVSGKSRGYGFVHYTEETAASKALKDMDGKVRAFIENNYKDLKTKNPKLPILIREATGIEPQLWARYDMGVERGIHLEGLNEEQISKALEDLAKGGAAVKG